MRHRVPFQALPEGLGYGTTKVVTSRLRAWRRLDGWDTFLEALKEKLPDGAEIDWSRLATKRFLPAEVGAAFSERREAGFPADYEISDAIWAEVWPKLPRAANSRDESNRTRTVSDRAAVSGFLFVVRYGIGWDDLPRELGYGTPTWVRQRVRAWQKLEGWEQFLEALKERLPYAEQADWSRVMSGGC
jgi:transposase